MAVSPDPMLKDLQEALKEVHFGDPESVDDHLKPILNNPVIFAVDLYQAGLGEKIENILRVMLVSGGVRTALQAV